MGTSDHVGSCCTTLMDRMYNYGQNNQVISCDVSIYDKEHTELKNLISKCVSFGMMVVSTIP